MDVGQSAGLLFPQVLQCFSGPSSQPGSGARRDLLFAAQGARQAEAALKSPVEAADDGAPSLWSKRAWPGPLWRSRPPPLGTDGQATRWARGSCQSNARFLRIMALLRHTPPPALGPQRHRFRGTRSGQSRGVAAQSQRVKLWPHGLPARLPHGGGTALRLLRLCDRTGPVAVGPSAARGIRVRLPLRSSWRIAVAKPVLVPVPIAAALTRSWPRTRRQALRLGRGPEDPDRNKPVSLKSTENGIPRTDMAPRRRGPGWLGARNTGAVADGAYQASGRNPTPRPVARPCGGAKFISGFQNARRLRRPSTVRHDQSAQARSPQGYSLLEPRRRSLGAPPNGAGNAAGKVCCPSCGACRPGTPPPPPWAHALASPGRGVRGVKGRTDNMALSEV